ncbi:MAG: tripartite tricarboxylate transporter permease, partial [Alphaproteobacteria bacterium]|nr:tripartite tricarboxylate transporter permease [Alphaproteobacteria bacterium]
AFGVPGSASMAILLGAFMIHGLQPGPRMLTEHLDVTYGMVWSIALANVLGAGLCFLFSGQFAKIAMLRYTLILPAVMTVLYVGAFQGTRDWGDLYALLFFGVLGWTMKRLRWPRPPLILGFVLGAIIERYMFISVARYEWEWLYRPAVAILLGMALLGMFRPLISEFLANRKAGRATPLIGRPVFHPAALFHVGLIALILVMIAETGSWEEEAKIAPLIVAWFALGCAVVSLFHQVFRAPAIARATRAEAGSDVPRSIHMDLVADDAWLTPGLILRRAGIFFGWLVAFMASMAAIGMLPTAFLFVVAYMRLENREPWRLVLLMAGSIALFVYVVFDRFLSVPWPPTLLGEWIPVLKFIPTI